MKILYYSSHPNLNLASPSGYGTHMREMIAGFESLGHEVKPVIMGGTTIDKNNISIKTRSGWKKIIAGMIPAYLWESAKDYRLLQFDKWAFKVLEKEIENFQPDFIYERSAYLQTSGVRIARKFGVKHVQEVNAPYVEERKVLQGDSYFIQKGVEAEKQQLVNSDRIVVVSNALKNHFIDTYYIHKDKFITIPNAINPSHLKYDVVKSGVIRNQLNLENKLVIGFVGSIFPWHGVDLLIESFNQFIKSGKRNSHLLIVGDGEILSKLKDQARRSGNADKISFTGNVPHNEVFNYLQVMDICVMGKSNWYGSPVKIFEYGAMGKAIIAPNNGPVRDVMDHKLTGLLSEPTTESLFNAINLFFEDDSLRQKCAKKFKEKVLLEHTWSENAKKVLDSLDG